MILQGKATSGIGIAKMWVSKIENIFKEKSEVNDLVKGLPIIPDEYKPIIKLINKKPILPSNEELDENSRSKSAKLRIIERI